MKRLPEHPGWLLAGKGFICFGTIRGGLVNSMLRRLINVAAQRHHVRPGQCFQ